MDSEEIHLLVIYLSLPTLVPKGVCLNYYVMLYFYSLFGIFIVKHFVKTLIQVEPQQPLSLAE